MEEQVLAVQRMQDYIESHLCETITLAQLADVSFFSPWYSHRMFREHTNYTPAEYIRRLRLSKSALQLRDEKCKIIDVAFRLGFGSADSYTRAFLRTFGCTPKEYAKSPIPLTLFIPYGVKFRELNKEKKKMKKTQSIFIQTIEKPQRKVIIKRGTKADDYFSYCEEVGCDVWGTLTSIPSLCGEPVCLWLPDAYVTLNTSTYVQGTEVSIDYNGIIPDGFDVIELHATTYLMFQGEPFHEEDYCEAITNVQNAAKHYNPQYIGLQWDNSYPHIQLEPIGKRGYIELYPVVSIKEK